MLNDVDNGCGCAETTAKTPAESGGSEKKICSYKIVPIPVNILIHIGFEKITMLKNGRTLTLSKLLHYFFFYSRIKFSFFHASFFLTFLQFGHCFFNVPTNLNK